MLAKIALAAVVAATLVAADRRSDCISEGRAWCPAKPAGQGNGLCYNPDNTNMCCGADTPTPAVCGQFEGSQCCLIENTAGCCEATQTCCYNYKYNQTSCADPHSAECCTKDISIETGHGVCSKYCSDMGSSLCKSSWGKSKNCSWSDSLFQCFDTNAYTKCSNETAGNTVLCDVGGTCCKGNNGHVQCCQDGATCNPALPQLCIPKNPPCSFWEHDKTQCALHSTCDYCGSCYNKSNGNVNCCKGNGQSAGRMCSSDSTCCAKSTSADGRSACCFSGQQCCLDLTNGASKNTSTCVFEHCCPAHIQKEHGHVGCSKSCSEIQYHSLCTDAKWNPDCLWAGPRSSGTCYNKANPPCSKNQTICMDSWDNTMCCSADEKCIWGARCIKKADFNKPCSHWDNDQNTCLFFEGCYSCGGGSCVNATAGQCCPSFKCTDGKCCLNNPSGCCTGDSGKSTCCMYENSKCCKTSGGDPYCCNQLDTCGTGSTPKCTPMNSTNL